MKRFAGHVYSIENFGHDDVLALALEELREIPDSAFDLLENPFEKKLTLHDVKSLPTFLGSAIALLEVPWRDWASKEFGIELIPDMSRHYCSVFKYLPGGFLACHVDAGVHPLNFKRKHAAAILYLGEVDEGGELELWTGQSASLQNPVITEPSMKIKPEHGNIVFLEGNDRSWHAVSECRGEKPRYAITVSYLSNDWSQWHQRQRAFFVPRPNEKWDAETYMLRDLRADEIRYAEAYRT